MQEQERYEIKGRIGEGGRGAVYRAYDRQLSRDVAIKRIFTNGAGEDASEDVTKESHALSAINSPHIVRVFDIARDEEGPFVVMELLEGKTIHEIVSLAPLVREDFLSVAEQGLEALIAAHAAKLLHRDIKPGNLMLTWLPSGRLQLKLLDFGLAKFAEKPAVQTTGQEGSVLGSIYFMAPEQFDRTALDVRSDLYALGCVFYYALTGQFPFTGGSATEVMAAHVQGNCAELQPLRPDLPPAVCAWVMRLISREMDDRPASAQQALADLEAAKLDPTPVAAAARVPSGPRLRVGAEAGSGTQPVNLSHSATQPVQTSPVPGHTTSTTRVAASGAGTVRARSSSLPPWALVVGGLLILTIVALGVAMAMRGDPGKTVAPSTLPLPAEEPAVEPNPTPAPKPPVKDPEVATVPLPEPTPEAPKWNASQEFKKSDKDGDFKISRDEFVRAKTNPLKSTQGRQFVELDKDNDGFLSLTEFKKQRGPGK